MTSPVPPNDTGRESWQPLVVVLLTIAVWSYMATKNVFWQDEYFSFDTALRSLGGTYTQALHFELQPPLYFVLLHFWLKLGATPIIGRALSLVFTLLTVLVLVRTGRELGIRRPWTYLGLAVAITPMFAWAAVQSRTYSLAILLTSCTLLLFVRLWVGDRSPRLRDYVAYVVFAYLALLTNYYSGFVLAGQFLAGLAISQRRRQLVMSFVALTVAFLPWVPTVLMQIELHPVSYAQEPLPVQTTGPQALLAPITSAWQSLTQAVLRGSFVLRPAVGFALAGGLALLLALRLQGRPSWSRAETALALIVVVPAGCLMLLRAFDVAFVSVRHWAVITPVVVLFVVTIIDRIEPAHVRNAIMSGLVVVFLGGLISTSRNLILEDWRAAGRFLQERATPNDPVTVFPSHGIGPLEYYLDGRAPVYGLPIQDPLVSLVPLTSADQLRARLEQIAGPDGTFWLVLGSIDIGPHLGTPFLDEYLEEATILEERTFVGLTTYHVRQP